MVIRTLTIAGIAAAIVMLLASVAASHCTTYSTSTTSTEMLVIPIPLIGLTSAEGEWLVIDLCQVEFECGFFARYYAGTNGIEGLQRWDERVDDTCHDMIAPDTAV